MSGSDLIFCLEGPLKEKGILYKKYIQHHFVFAFETDSKRWCRIISVDRDGTYHKDPVTVSGDIEKFPPDHPKNAIISDYGRLVIWSPASGKICICFDNEIDKYPDERRSEIQKYYDEQFQSCQPIKSNNFLSGVFRDPLELGIFVSKPDYRIFGIKETIMNHDPSFQEKSGKEISFKTSNSVLFRRNSANALGVFVNYYLPRTWERDVFLVFEYE